MKKALRLVLAGVLAFGLAACGNDTRDAVPAAELKPLLDPITPPPDATRVSEDLASGTCESVTQKYVYNGTTKALLAHYQTQAQNAGWSPVGQIGGAEDTAEQSYLKDRDGEPLFMQVTDDRSTNSYELLIRSTPSSGATC